MILVMLQVYKTWLFLYDLTYLSLVWPSFDRNTCLALVVCTSVGIVKQHGFRSHFLCLQRMLHSLVSNQWLMICWMKMKLPWYDGWHCPGINACHWVFLCVCQQRDTWWELAHCFRLELRSVNLWQRRSAHCLNCVHTSCNLLKWWPYLFVCF